MRTGRCSGRECYCQPLRDVRAASLAELCRRYGVEDEAHASNMVVTVKRRFKRVLRRLVRQTVDSDAKVDEEIEELIRILGNAGARS